MSHSSEKSSFYLTITVKNGGVVSQSACPVKHAVRAFTLIELLVVIAIISVLMAILTPTLRRARERTRETICRSNLKGVGVALFMYLQDNDYKTADSSGTNGFFWYDYMGSFRTTDDYDAYWGVAYRNYIRETKVFGCQVIKMLLS